MSELPTGPYVPPKHLVKKASDIIDANARKATRAFAIIILSYLAWKGVAGLLESAQLAKQTAAYAVVLGLLAILWLV
jgi:hypothetical protein